ncbi:dihydrofolate reductase family protein [Clostridium aestuarii]|uniref:Dihydrofolate reductase family protein n=1 Tax=Clostridium aestuarii TaxID=338193 RepID=A0ABT4D2L6_9CLOT|nr:dihydrofolate reductase family protein [Clostridium aestuarii]MCY6485493.1 dihydrofolate reductase family protein [Clostridium aestuarii]
MSRSIILYIATSLDGYIARENGAVDWLSGNGDNPNVDNGYTNFYNTIDTVVMGRTTYEQVINELSPDNWVYEGKKCYVATTRKCEMDKRAEFISEDIAGFIKKLKKQQGKDIWLIGGGKLIDQFIKQDLIDKYIVTIIPTILGDGIPLFLKENPEIKLRLVETKTIDGMVELSYIRR